MKFWKDKRLIFVFLIPLFLISYRLANPNEHSINANFFKANPDFIYEKTGNSLLICLADDYSEELKELLDDPDLPFKTKKRWIKDAQSRSILTWRIAGKKHVIKRYNSKGISHWIKQLIPYTSSKALRAFYFSYLFDQMDIKSAKSIAVIEKRFGPFLGTSYQIMEHIKGMKGSDFFDDANLPPIDYEKSVKETIEIAQKLENANLIHGDLTLGHLFYVDGTPHLIDLDSVQRKTSKKSISKLQKQHSELELLKKSLGKTLSSKEQKALYSCAHKILN